MSRDTSPPTKAAFVALEQHGYRCDLGELDGIWIATAKRDHDGQFHSAKASTEEEAVVGLAESVGVELAGG